MGKLKADKLRSHSYIQPTRHLCNHGFSHLNHKNVIFISKLRVFKFRIMRRKCDVTRQIPFFHRKTLIPSSSQKLKNHYFSQSRVKQWTRCSWDLYYFFLLYRCREIRRLDFLVVSTFADPEQPCASPLSILNIFNSPFIPGPHTQEYVKPPVYQK